MMLLVVVLRVVLVLVPLLLRCAAAYRQTCALRSPDPCAAASRCAAVVGQTPQAALQQRPKDW